MHRAVQQTGLYTPLNRAYVACLTLLQQNPITWHWGATITSALRVTTRNPCLAKEGTGRDAMQHIIGI
jgi:hypothetical protein